MDEIGGYLSLKFQVPWKLKWREGSLGVQGTADAAPSDADVTALVQLIDETGSLRPLH